MASSAVTYSDRDLSLLPDWLLSQNFVDNYLQSTSKDSGKTHMHKAYKYFHEKYLRNRQITKTSTGCRLSAECFASQRNKVYSIWVTLRFDGDTGSVEDAKCECPKAQGKGCSHIGALLYDIGHLKKLGNKVIPIDPVKTSQPQTWHKPRGEKITGVEVQDIVAVGYSKKHNPMEAPKRTVKSTLYNPLRTEMPDHADLYASLNKVSPSSMILPALELSVSGSVQMVETSFGKFQKGSVLSVHQKLNPKYNISIFDNFDYPLLPVSNKIENNMVAFPLTKEKQLKLESLKCTVEEVHTFEEETRLQSECGLWFKLKKDRLSASKMRSVLTRKENFEKLADDLRKKTRQTLAMATGLSNEPIAVDRYVQVLDGANVYPVGIVISPWAFWIAATPDRKVYIPNRQPAIGILEIKCPCVTSVLEVSYLKRVGDRLQLNHNHAYFTQVQTQLGVTGLEWCDFFVWCENDFHLETIFFDAEEWHAIKDKADQFFFNYYL